MSESGASLLNKDYGPSGGSGQTPGSSQYTSPFNQPQGFNTHEAIKADNVANAQMSSANNMETMTALMQSRSGGFTMNDSQGMPVSFTTDKGAGNHLMMNGHDTGMPYQQFSGMMQDPMLASTFSNALSSSDLSNKDVYNTTNSLLQEMNLSNDQANQRQRVSNNSGDINSKMQHKEMMKEMSGGESDEYQ